MDETRWNEILSAGRRQAEQVPPDLDLARFRAANDALNALSKGYFTAALRKLGVFTRDGEHHTVDKLIADCQIAPHYLRLVTRWLDALIMDGALVRRGEGIESPSALAVPDHAAALEAVARYGNFHSDVIGYLERSGENLVEILTGQVHPIEFVFAEGSADVPLFAYQYGPVARYMNSIVREVARAAVHQLPSPAPIRALEIGAGTGGTTAVVLPVLPAERMTYYFTDVSKYFTIEANKRFRDYAFMRYSLYNVEQPPSKCGLPTGTFDMVLAFNVLHATRRLDETLAHVKALLRPGGVVILLEITQAETWFNMAMSLLEGNTRFEDDRVKQNHSFLTDAQWTHRLTQAGFARAQSFPAPTSAMAKVGQHVIVSQLPG